MKAITVLLAVFACVTAATECFSHTPIRPLAYAPSTPGFTTAFSQKGLDYVKDVGIAILEKKISTVVIKDLNGTADATVVIGKIDYDLSNIHINDVAFTQASVQIQKDVGLHVVIQNSGASGSLDWHWRGQRWPHVHGTGKANFSFTLDADLMLQFTVVDDHLQISSIPAKVTVDNFDVDIHDTKNGWFYKIILGLFDGVLKNAIANGLQKAFPTSITDSIDKALMNVPIRQQVVDPVIFDIGLIRQPLFTDSVFRLYEAGDSYIKSDPTPCPSTTCHAVQLPEAVTSTRMVQMYMSESVPTSLARAFMMAGFLKYTVTNSILPPNFLFKLNTLLLKPYLPALQAAYPDSDVHLVASVTETPQISFIAGVGASAKVDGTLTIMVQNTTGSSLYVEAIVLDIEVKAVALASLAGWQVYGKVSNTSLIATVKSSNVGFVDNKNIQFILNFALQYALPSINELLKNGVTLPNVPGFSISGADITHGQGYLSLGIDVSYNVSATR